MLDGRITLGFSLLLVSCSIDKIDQFDAVEVGMTHAEVRETLGAPSSMFSREVDDRGRVVRMERWQYGDTPSTLATGAVFSEHPSSRVWVVYFDDRGRVLEVAEPDWSYEPSPNIAPNPIPPRNQ